MLGGSAGIPALIEDVVVTADFNDMEVASAIEQQGRRLAAVIVEPIQRIIPPRAASSSSSAGPPRAAAPS